MCDWGDCETPPNHKIKIGREETYFLCDEHRERAQSGEMIPGERTEDHS